MLQMDSCDDSAKSKYSPSIATASNGLSNTLTGLSANYEKAVEVATTSYLSSAKLRKAVITLAYNFTFKICLK